MIKIIKKGKIKGLKQLSFRMICGDCNCEFEASKEDFNLVKKDDERFFEGSILCPTCNREIFVCHDSEDSRSRNLWRVSV